MNLLQIVQEHARRQGLPQPTSVGGSKDGYALQAMGLLNEFNDDLNTRKMWQTNVRETTWNALPQESQGTLVSLAPFCYEGIVPGTLMQHAMRRLIEVISPQEWQARKVSNVVGPYPAARLRGGELLMFPPPANGEVLSFEYYSSAFTYFPGRAGSGSMPPSYNRYWANDEDTSSVGPDLALAYLRWAWKREKGFDYAEDFAKYERMLVTKNARNLAPQVVDMGDYPRTVRPGIIVPEGSWVLP